MLKWLQGHPGPALNSLLPCQEQPQSPAASSSDRSINPGQLGASQPSTSSQVGPSPQSGNSAHNTAAVSGETNSQAYALDLVCYCLASGTSTWPGQLPSVKQLCQLALQAAHKLEAHGHHVMALDAQQIAQMCNQRLSGPLTSCTSTSRPVSADAASKTRPEEASLDAEHQELILSCCHDRLITASLLRCLVDTTHPSNSTPLLDPLAPHPLPLIARDAEHFLSQRWTLHRTRGTGIVPPPDQKIWRKLAQQQIKALQDAGFQVDAGLATARLQAVYDSLLPGTVEEVQHEESTESVAAGGLFRSISGMSALSTPRRNSTFSRCCTHADLQELFATMLRRMSRLLECIYSHIFRPCTTSCRLCSTAVKVVCGLHYMINTALPACDVLQHADRLATYSL